MTHHPDCFALWTGNPADCICANRKEQHLNIRAFVLSLIAGGIEYAVFIIGGSVALLSDVAHIVADSLSYLEMILVVFIISRHPALRRQATIYGTWINLLFLVWADALVFQESFDRMIHQHAILTLPTLCAILVGLFLNVVVLAISRKTPTHQQNIRHATVDAHALSDMLVSFAILGSTGITMASGWLAADWIAGLGVATYLLVWPIRKLWVKLVRGNIRLQDLRHSHDEHDHRDHDNKDDCDDGDDHHNNRPHHERYAPQYYTHPAHREIFTKEDYEHQQRIREIIFKGLRKHRKTKPRKRPKKS